MHWKLLPCAVLTGMSVRFDLTAARVIFLSIVTLIGLHEASRVIEAKFAGLEVISITISGFVIKCMLEKEKPLRSAFPITATGISGQAAQLASTVANITIAGSPSSVYGSYMVEIFTWADGAGIAGNLTPIKG
jgi:hypothetical protein